MKPLEISSSMVIASLLLLTAHIHPSHPQFITGPNVCGSHSNSHCCPGWNLHPTLRKCFVPTCIQDCGEGYCQRPNLCFCPDDQLFSVTGCGVNRVTYKDETQCNPRCVNGGHCGNGNQCTCLYGFTGLTCEIDYRTGPCFTEEDGGTCSNSIAGFSSSKAMCCATVGYAWGNRCESCSTLDTPCPRGFISDQRNSECIDVNECFLVPGLCASGTCTNTDGAFICGQEDPISYNTTDVTQGEEYITGPCFTSDTCSGSTPGARSTKGVCCVTIGRRWGHSCEPCSYNRPCPKGFISNKKTGECLDVNECLHIQGLCSSGTCHNTEGAYICEDYLRPTGPCFTTDTCSDSIPSLRSTKGVCCATVGRKWGHSCERCSFNIPCSKGFISNHKTGECLDVNECLLIQGLCSNGTCHNTEGGFICEETGTPIAFNNSVTSIHELNQLNYDAFMQLFGNIVENAPWITSALWSYRPFTRAFDLHQKVLSILDEIPLVVQEAVLRGVPDITEKVARKNQRTPESTSRHEAAGLNDISQKQLQIITDLNSRYKDKFEFPFVIRENIFESINNGLNTRIHNSREQEVLVGIGEIKKISWDKINELILYTI